MRKAILLGLLLLCVGNASAAVLKQDNQSRIAINFSTSQPTQNFTTYFNIPINSSISAAWLGSVRGPAYEVIASKDTRVSNFSGFRDYANTDPALFSSYSSDQTRTNSYFYFNTSLDMSTFDETLLVLPYGGNQMHGSFNVTVYEVFENATWTDESSLTWNNQPCGVGHTPNGTFCNTTYADKQPIFAVDNQTYNCSSDRLILNVTQMAKRRKNNVSFLVSLERNETYTGSFDVVDWCSKETGLNYNNNQSFPTQPSLYFGKFLSPSNVTVWINGSIANVSTTVLNSSNRLNLTLNASLPNNLSRLFRVSPIPVTFQIGGPGVLEISELAFLYQANGLAATLSFNDTSPYVVSWSSGAGTFVKEFTINNSGTADAKNCSLSVAVQSGSSLAPYLSYPNNFSVVNQSSVVINITTTNPADGQYNNFVNAVCSIEGNNESFTTLAPINFFFSISSPAISTGGGGGGSTVLIGQENISINPSFIDQNYVLGFGKSGVWTREAIPSVAIASCQIDPPFTCSVDKDGTAITISRPVEFSMAASSIYNAELTLTSKQTGSVTVVPVRLRVYYLGIALAGEVLLLGGLVYGAKKLFIG